MLETIRDSEETAEVERPRATVCLVDANEASREAIAALLEVRGYTLRAFASVEAFLAAGATSRPGCLILDYDLPGVSGREVQQRLSERSRTLPVIVTLGTADVPAAVRFMERCTVTLLEKPFQSERLLAAVEEAVELDTIQSRVRRRFEEIGAAVEQLSPRERTVLQAIVAGQLNKAIAKALEVSVRTIEGDRAKIVEKFHAETTGEVVGKYAQFSLLAELGYDGGKTPRVCV
jgi:two-component system response regulator DctR